MNRGDLNTLNEAKNIALTGPPGSGKSAVGRLLAETLGREFADMDELLKQRFGCSIGDYFAAEGEASFRRAEALLCAELGAKQGLVIATGGGVLQNAQNKEHLQRNGILVNLRASLSTLEARLKASEARPLLEGDLTFRLSALIKERQATYDAVEIQVDTDEQSLSDVVRRIAEFVVQEEGQDKQ